MYSQSLVALDAETNDPCWTCKEEPNRPFESWRTLTPILGLAFYRAVEEPLEELSQLRGCCFQSYDRDRLLKESLRCLGEM